MWLKYKLRHLQLNNTVLRIIQLHTLQLYRVNKYINMYERWESERGGEGEVESKREI